MNHNNKCNNNSTITLSSIVASKNTSKNSSIFNFENENNLISSLKEKISPKKINNLKCLYTNATSLGNKFEELELITKVENIDLIFITETWFTESNFKNISGFEPFNYFRSGKTGGGVTIFVNKKFSSFEIYDEILCDKKI